MPVIFHRLVIMTKYTEISSRFMKEKVGRIGRVGIMTTGTVAIPERNVLIVPEGVLPHLAVA